MRKRLLRQKVRFKITIEQSIEHLYSTEHTLNIGSPVDSLGSITGELSSQMTLLSSKVISILPIAGNSFYTCLV